MKATSVLGGAVLAALLAVGGVSAASAASSRSPAAPDSLHSLDLLTASGQTVAATEPWGPRLAQACSRIPDRITRAEQLQTRLHADAGTRGSLAYLQGRIDRAKADGHTDRARLLGDRLAVRKDLDARLPDVITRLKDAKTVCDAHPAPSPAPAASSS